MNWNLTLDSYVCTYIIRALSAFAVCIVAIAGLAVADYDATGNRYRYKEVNKKFLFAFFSFTLVYEAVAGVMYLSLWAKQRGKHDISRINKIDCQGSCFFILLRLVWTIGLSIFQLVSFYQLERGPAGDPYNMITHGENERKRELDVIRTIVITLLIFELAQIIGFVFGLAYQPQDYVREVRFDALESKGGVVPEISANEQIYKRKVEEERKEINNQQRIREIKYKQ